MHTAHTDVVATLRARLAGGAALPGLEAQLTMSPPYRGDPADLVEISLGCREAAVLILLFPLADGRPGLVLTLRQRALQAHSGQVSLPGGGLERGETAVEAALREAFEEVGVPRDEPQVLGELTELYIPPSHFCVTPVVASLDRQPGFAPQAEEVATIIVTPLATLFDPACRREAERSIHGTLVPVPYYAVEGFEVWGATAMILAELAALLAPASD
jgi:8-oxo-dGTP pyrophosphatase MutT (NUDIX family)